MRFHELDKRKFKERKSLINKIRAIIKNAKASRQTSKSNIKRKTYRPKNSKKLLNLIIIVILIATAIIALYYLINYVSGLRENVRSGGSLSTDKKVVGFDSVPEYPNSVFIFEDDLNNDDVKRFLTSGQSIYRLNPKTSYPEVVKYYKEVLPKNGWEYVLNVPLESEEQKPGDYWVKDGKGIRIYSKLNDIWYESTTVEEAKTGLKAQVAKEVELKLLLAENNNQDLRPDYPWVLSFSTDYVAAYTGSDLGELQIVTISKLGSNKKVILEPLGYIGAFSYDKFLENGLSKINKRDKTKWNIVNTSVTVVAGNEAIQGKISNSGTAADVYVVGNPRNNVVYLFRSEVEGDPFLKFLIERIKPASSTLN